VNDHSSNIIFAVYEYALIFFICKLHVKVCTLVVVISDLSIY